MDFGRNLLKKYGWNDGEGLGKNKDGLITPLRAKLKQNTHGVGYSPGEEFKNNWWERVFDDAAANIQPVADENGTVTRTEIKEIATRRKKKKTEDPSGYGSFVKKSCWSGGKTVRTAESSSEDEANTRITNDEELFAICGGRTGHKGSRHGLTLSGKLARLEQQEKLLSSKDIADCGKVESKRKTADAAAVKRKKRKRVEK